jgi:hypothetical protein
VNISANFPFWLAKDLADLAQNYVRFGAVVGRRRLGPDFKPDKRRICRAEDRRTQISGGAVQKQDNICGAPCSLKSKGCTDRSVPLVGQQQQAKPLRDGQRQEQHDQQLPAKRLREQLAQYREARAHGIALTSAARL